MKSSALAVTVVCWTARILALALFFLWGAFFVEHLREWFMHPAQGFPPVWVWLAQLAHLAVLVGLIALWRWQLAGSLITIVAATLFFGGLAISTGIAGHRYLPLLAFLTITIIPAVLTLGCWLARGAISGDQRPLAGAPARPN